MYEELTKERYQLYWGHLRTINDNPGHYVTGNTSKIKIIGGEGLAGTAAADGQQNSPGNCNIIFFNNPGSRGASFRMERETLGPEIRQTGQPCPLF